MSSTSNTTAANANRFIRTHVHRQLFVFILQQSQCAIIALITLCIFTNTVAVQAPTPCSISAVNFYPQTAYEGQTASVTSQVVFTCGPSYNNVWKVRVQISNFQYNITSTSTVQSIYAGYTNTAVNVTNTFKVPMKAGPLSLGVNVYVMEQSSSTIFASWSSTLKIQVQAIAPTVTTSTSAPLPSTTAPAYTTVTLATLATQSGFSLSTDEIYTIIAIVLVALFVIVVIIRLKQTLRKYTHDSRDDPTLAPKGKPTIGNINSRYSAKSIQNPPNQTASFLSFLLENPSSDTLQGISSPPGSTVPVLAKFMLNLTCSCCNSR